MTRQRRWRRLLDSGLLALGLAGGAGCMCYLHPISPPAAHLAEPCHAVPQCARDHVYIFLIHGMDPLDYANLTGLRDWIQEMGFHKTYYGQMFHTLHFESEARHIHEEDPHARFVLIGFSFGANMVRSLAQSMRKDHIPVDLLVYLGGNTLHNNEEDQPDNCTKILNILASGAIWHGDTMERAENIHVPDVWHFGSPTHRATQEALARELAVVAAHVDAVEVGPMPRGSPGLMSEPPAPPPGEEPEKLPTPRPQEPEPLPAPRKTQPEEEKESARGPWDFLKPVSRLGGSSSVGATPASAPREGEKDLGPVKEYTPIPGGHEPSGL